MDRLYARCSKLILDCVDWQSPSVSFSGVTHAYDTLHELYCASLSVTKGGLPFSQVKQLREFVKFGKEERERAKISGEKKLTKK